MSTNGQLVFTDVDKITFKGVGNTSNAVVDTVTGKIGVGIDSPDANLHVLGNSYVSTNLELGGTLIMGTVNVSAHHSLEAVTAEGNTTPLTVEFSNATTGIVTTGNVEVGNELTVSGNVFFTSNVTTSVDSNVVMEHTGPHGRLPKAMPLRKYPEIVFDASKLDGNDSTNTYVQAGYTVSASSDQSQYDLHAWKIFDGVKSIGNGWASQDGTYYDGSSPANSYNGATHQLGTGTAYGEWLKLELPNKIKVSKFTLYADKGVSYGTDEAPKSYKIYGSVTGSSWTEIKDVSNETPSTNGNSHDITDTTAYKYLAIVVTQVNTDQDNIRIGELEYYGYEEDPPVGDSSLDATFKSVLNTPQTTGVQVYVDAKLTSDFTNQMTDPTPTGTSTTHNNTGKYWTLTGALTSNVTLEANTFLEGDQPHAVSVWFNSSNLEANVSNTCVFSVSDQEHLNSQNLDLQSNTWHNLTYAYQGEGGSRVTYLDGRKVAEDQAEDTFGEYPPFAMTGYSQGGYVVSASSEYGSAYLAHEAFNGTFAVNGDAWLSGNLSNYNGGSGQYSGSANLGSDSGGPAFADADKGEWLKLEMPHKFVLDYITICGSTSLTVNPKNWKIYGSNDDKNWDVLLSKTNSVTVAYNATSGKEHVVGATKAYKYFALVVTATNGFVTYTQVAELEFYGHRENDLVRLPDPTRVLKYPHVTLTEDARRGYVASASGIHSNGNHPTWKAFDGVITNDWQIDGGRYSNSGGVYTHNAGETTVTNVQSRVGDWVQLESPHKIRVKTMKFTPIATYGQERSPATGVLVGSNDDGSTWTEIKVFDVTTDGTPTSYTAASPTTLAIDSGSNSNPGYYKIHRLIWLTLYTASQTTYADRASVADLEFYGTGVDSIPIQIGGGNIDKVANFRVYDKFVEEDQALEIWDAQKDEFERVKSSMTLHKGRLGIGTTEPEGRLAVADEPDPDAYGLQRIPPKPASGYDTYIDGYGMFQVSTSNAGGGAAAAYWAFDHDIDRNTNAWRNSGSPYTSGTWNSTQTASTTENSNTHVGHWIQLYTPVKYSLKSHKVSARHTHTYRQPYSAVVLGSTDGSTWNLLDTWTTTDVNRVKRSITIDNTTLYNYFRLVVKALENNGDAARADLGEWELYGIREQSPPKQSVLHDGQLTLTKNLTVPRIGPMFGEYPTPRRNDLLLEYNTALSIHSGDHVIDTSGNSNDGNFNGDATYSEGNRAFEFDGSGDWIYPDSAIVNPAGAWPHSFSIWINTRVNNIGTFFSLGVESSHQSSTVRINSSSVINWFFYSNDVSFNLPNGLTIDGTGSTWYHFAGIYNGGSDSTSRRMWMNGQELTVANPSSSFSSLNIPTNTSLRMGIRKNGTQGFNGFISNFRLYNCVLTPNEIFTLYKQGRVPPVHHLQLIDSTMTIGPHSRDPGAHLDVAGHIRAGSQTIHTFTGQHRCFPDEPVEKGLIVSAKKNRFVKLNGFATGQEAITMDESLPIVSLSNVAEDKACFGVVSSIEKPTPKRTQVTNGIISDSKKERGDNRAIVNSVGEGAIWVVNTGGPLESGDYITTSNVVGYGQKQDSEFLANYTVAKITMDCDFEPVIQPVQVIKKDDDGMNILDEHGQIQWEDHPTETERAYKVRYLTTDGIQTDEANAVHIAAFVGCTYHCG